MSDQLTYNWWTTLHLIEDRGSSVTSFLFSSWNWNPTLLIFLLRYRILHFGPHPWNLLHSILVRLTSLDSSSSPLANLKLVLYSSWTSSSSWRVRFALNLKGLPYEYKAVDLAKGEQFSSEFEQLNPLHFVPVLVDDDFVVSDSFAILLYLEDKYPQNALLPADVRRKTLNLQVAGIVSSSIQPLQMLGVLKQIEEKAGPKERQQWAEHHIRKGFIALEKLLKDFSGKYATGDEICMADVFLAPQINNAITRFNIDMSDFPNLVKIYEAYKVLPAFQASLPECQPDAVV